MTTQPLRNVVVVGGSYVGMAAAKELANLLPASHRVLLVEPHSHFHHLFAFPRFAIVPSYEHKAFIPYSSVFSEAPDGARNQVVRASVSSLHPQHVTLDREWQGSRDLPFEYLVAATGTRLAPPGSMPSEDKAPSVRYLQTYQQGIKQAHSVVVIGGGAVGVQMACDLKEVYPDKTITLVHSREKLMPVYHEALSNLIRARFETLGINLVTGSRAVVPPGGFPNNGGEGRKPFDVRLQDGRAVSAEFAILATGQIPNNQFLTGLGGPQGALVNPANGFIRVRPTLQFQDERFPHLFAVGDIAETGAHKAARPGAVQAAVAAKNIAALVAGGEPVETITVAPPGIHLTLGLTQNVIFRNPNTAAGDTEPVIKLKDDGQEDMNIEGVWARRGVRVVSVQDYHL
ncbi:hypothetical protein B0H63DRAFT_448988 [Podospora didyma]|uniref:FAD/NAD(P)-binding domain-containing protein n=1 Tax=Podospora didyma TaxID=330526 RepID=A0AAE0NNP5_9PEZI|nr:hypothetical protein B0H63DRAFT_448988 [Podospora didyma]